MCITILNIFSHPRDVITDVLTEVMFGVGVIMVATPTITVEFVVGETYAADALTDVLTVLIISAVSDIDVDTLADENANDLAAVMSPPEFAMPTP